MNVFISWSEERSKKVASALSSWIPDVLQDVKTWMSEQDIEAGSRWASEVSTMLQESDFGVVCLTPENLKAPWILFEAGALSKMIDKSNVVPFRFGLDATDVAPPLSQFQGVNADKEGTYRLVMSINRARKTPIPQEKLERTFDLWWPQLEQKINEVPEASSPKHQRPDRDVLEEILSQVRTLGKNSSDSLGILRALGKGSAVSAGTVKKTSSNWYTLTSPPDSQGEDAEVTCNRCGATETFDPRYGEKPSAKCRSCGLATQ